MLRKSGRFWLLKAFGIFLICLVLWYGMVIWTGRAFGGEITFVEEFRSRLLANYGIDLSGQSMRYLSLTILGEVFSDEGLSEESLIVMDALFEDPVPTATLDGEQVTNNPTPTQIPSNTPDQTSTAWAEETRIAKFTPVMTNTPTSTATSTLTPTSTFTATPTPTTTLKPSKTPTPTKVIIDDVIPLLICVKYHGGGEYEAIFGYENPSTQIQSIPIGDRNRFEPTPKDRGQPTTFKPGEHGANSGEIFGVYFDGLSLKWHLTSSSVLASSSSTDCEGVFAPTPTPIDTAYPMVGTGYLSPPQGLLTGCSANIHVDNLYVEDEYFSSGINWVKLKYVVEGYTSDLYSDPLTLVSGGFTSFGWEGYYSGFVFVEINPNWIASNDFYIKVYGKARDNAGHESYMTLGSYTMSADCGIPPTPSPTPTSP